MSLTVGLFCLSIEARAQAQNLTVSGKLFRAMAVGGESTGWAIQFEAPITVERKQLSSIEIYSREISQLEKLENKKVQASGKLSHRHGVERGDRTILEVSSIQEIHTPEAFNLTGTDWLLEDLGGNGVMDNVRATLAFPEGGKVAGNGSCNRFFGSVEINGDVIKVGPLGATRMACPEALMNQETKYLNALQEAERFEWRDPYLLVYCKGLEKPLRFTRSGNPTRGTAK